MARFHFFFFFSKWLSSIPLHCKVNYWADKMDMSKFHPSSYVWWVLGELVTSLLVLSTRREVLFEPVRISSVSWLWKAITSPGNPDLLEAVCAISNQQSSQWQRYHFPWAFHWPLGRTCSIIHNSLRATLAPTCLQEVCLYHSSLIVSGHLQGTHRSSLISSCSFHRGQVPG